MRYPISFYVAISWLSAFLYVSAYFISFPISAQSQNLASPALSDIDKPPVIPDVMNEKRYMALKKLFESEDAETQRGALCAFSSSQLTRTDSHSLRFIKTFVRLLEANTPDDLSIGFMPETTYSCTLRALTTTILTHNTFKSSTAYQQNHYGRLGSPTFYKEHFLPLYLPIVENPEHPLHKEAYYVIMALGDDVAEDVVPIFTKQLEAFENYTYDNQRKIETIVRTLHLMGFAAKPAVPKMVEFLMMEGEVDYEGNYGHDGKRGFNSELATALVSIAGYDKMYQRLILKAIEHAIDVDNAYWSDKVRPTDINGTTNFVFNLQQSRQKLLENMGIDTIDDMKHLF